MNRESEFFVGYLPLPAGVKRHVRRVILSLGAIVAAIAGLLIGGQHPFPDATFEFQQYREFRGTLLTSPYPALVIPGEPQPWLLVGPGKHGAGALASGEVQLRGERIFRGGDRMIELLPGSLQHVDTGTPPAPDKDLGPVELTGEIVDSKCYFGVMNPGNGKVHRDCAVRCISGGVPPALRVRDANGHAMTLLLANFKHELLNHIAEPVSIRGRLVRSSGRLTLFAE
ncbi:MAG TPA: hypothetical protein VKU19_00030 [Bryobacteraceae bacterium]|nr:hypothetical protein [Bryobacteraceae bacterium]